MKTKEPKKKSAKTAKTTKKSSSIKVVEPAAAKTPKSAGKLTKALPKTEKKIRTSAAKTAITEKTGSAGKPGKTSVKKKAVKSLIKPAAVRKPKPQKEAVKAKPVTKVGKVAAAKPKTAKKTGQETSKKKAVAVKTEEAARPKTAVKAKPVTKVGKVAAAKPKQVEQTEMEKTQAPARTKHARTVIQKAKAVSPQPELSARVKPSSKSVTPAVKYDTKEEPKTGAGLKIFLPDRNLTEEDAEDIFFGMLPEEYGENSVIALAVNPNTVFVDWEVVPGDISDKEGDLILRFYDVTGIEFNNSDAVTFTDVLINKRVGSGFFEIRMPGRDVVVALGIISAAGGFIPIVRSEMISFPELLKFDDLGIIQKLFESDIRLGY